MKGLLLLLAFPAAIALFYGAVWLLAQVAFWLTGGPGLGALLVMVGIVGLLWVWADRAGWL